MRFNEYPNSRFTPMPLDIFIPNKGSTLGTLLPPGSGIVSQQSTLNGQKTLYFEGNKYAVNLVDYEDRLMNAAGRLWEKYPTSKKMVISSDEFAEFTRVGSISLFRQLAEEYFQFFPGNDFVVIDRQTGMQLYRTNEGEIFTYEFDFLDESLDSLNAYIATYKSLSQCSYWPNGK